jgi:hypothetical protein
MKALLLLPLAALLVVTDASAGEHRYTLSPTYIAECGSCHVAYPPDLFGAAHWATLMQGLDRHFGTDASLDAKSQREIGEFLQSRASTRDKHLTNTKPPRLTETSRFRREHRGLSAPAKGSTLAQCNACHTRAEQGDFSEGSPKSSRR